MALPMVVPKIDTPALIPASANGKRSFAMVRFREGKLFKTLVEKPMNFIYAQSFKDSTILIFQVWPFTCEAHWAKGQPSS